MLCILMVSLDMTIANVALPHIMGSLSASGDQIVWVLTSYIVASAIVTPTTGWLESRFGRKRIFIVCTLGFVAASMLCGLAASLPQIVVFRILQGVFGAPMSPLAQAQMLDMNPPERHGSAMALFGMGALVGPIMGPALGGYITEHLDWRWVFYINVPIGAVALLGQVAFLPSGRRPAPRRFDFVGMGMLALSIAALQLMLDRGPGEDWFSSPEIWTYAAVAAAGLWVFVFYSATTRKPFFDPRLMADRNFTINTVMGIFLFLLTGSSVALVPPMLQTLLGYPVQTAGIVMMPRAFGTVVGMFLVGRMIGRFDHRLLLIIGIVLIGGANWSMTGFDLAMDIRPLVISSTVQGFGMGFLMVPLSAAAFVTLPGVLRAEGSALVSLTRSMSQGVGISLMQALLTRNTQTMHASLAARFSFSDPVVAAALPPVLTPEAASGVAAAVNAEINRQAAMVAYVDDFKLMTIIAFACMPLVLLLTGRKKPAPSARKELHAQAH